jgi:hypothetical protein
MDEISTSLYCLLYIIVVLYIIILYYTEASNPMETNIFEWIGLFVLIVLEFFIGFSVTKNTGTLFLAVFVTWIVIFAPTLLIYRSALSKWYVDELNSIFSNVIGYLFISNEASSILSELGLEKESDNDKETIIESKRLIAQINNSKNIFINQLTPGNFNYLWDNLFSPLFTEEIKKDKNIETRLKEITNKKFVIGKCIWYLYTCIIAITISSFFMTI